LSIKDILRGIVLLEEKKEPEILIKKMFFISVIGYTNDNNLFETWRKVIKNQFTQSRDLHIQRWGTTPWHSPPG